eukprot:s202_g27.t1
MRVLFFLASAVTAMAFVPPVSTRPHEALKAAPVMGGAAEEPTQSTGFCLALGASVGYAAAAMGAVSRQGRVSLKAEQSPPAAVARPKRCLNMWRFDSGGLSYFHLPVACGPRFGRANRLLLGCHQLHAVHPALRWSACCDCCRDGEFLRPDPKTGAWGPPTETDACGEFLAKTDPAE